MKIQDAIDNAKQDLDEKRKNFLRLADLIEEARAKEASAKTDLSTLIYEGKFSTRERLVAEADSSSARKSLIKLKSLQEACLSSISSGELSLRGLLARQRVEEIEEKRFEKSNLSILIKNIHEYKYLAEIAIGKYMAALAAKESTAVSNISLKNLSENRLLGFEVNSNKHAELFYQQATKGELNDY